MLCLQELAIDSNRVHIITPSFSKLHLLVILPFHASISVLSISLQNTPLKGSNDIRRDWNWMGHISYWSMLMMFI